MALLDIVFYLFAVIIIASAAVVVFSRNIMHSAFALLFTFFAVAGIYVLLNADFIAITQIMVYIGGILVLIIFGVMLTTKVTGVDIKSGPIGKVQLGFSILISVLVAIVLIVIYSNTQFVISTVDTPRSTIEPLGQALMTHYLLAFEVVAVLLLVALVGAALIARRRD